MDFRNIAIIAHVDHGKTTLVDGLLKQCHAFAAHQEVEDRVMDSMDLERERGITITSKNTAVSYGSTKINIMDTPGHADFGGEVERVLSMVEGALLLVDASEGPLPQTRFVLRKAMEQGLSLMVCINKIDRPDARAEEVLQEVYDLFIELDADEEQLEFPVLYAIARDGIAQTDLNTPGTDLRPLLDAIIEHIPPPQKEEGDARLVVTNLDYDAYVGRLCLGRLRGGTLKKNQQVRWFYEGGDKNVRAQLLYTWNGLKRVEVEEALPGDVIAIAGVEGITVGDTIAGGDDPQPLPRIQVDEPTIGMTMSINTSPLSGREGKLLTARQIRGRLERELLSNVSLKMELGDTAESFKVYGRGELQLAILVEQMRREGFEMTISRPEVVLREVDGETLEPFEEVTLDVPDDVVGAVTQHMAARKAEMIDLQADGTGRSRMVYKIPTRGLIGFRSKLLTESRGEGVMNSLFIGWEPHAGFIQGRANGALVSDRSGTTTTYTLFKLQPRGRLFVGPGVDIYEGMIVGEHVRENDLNVNATRAKQLTNFRTVNADEKQILAPPVQVTLEWAMEWVDSDEVAEITPTSIRIRKKILEGNKRTIIRGEKGEAKKGKEARA
ncbi:MAG: translational GTPase TypA [Alphaproteobacteria bacterium]|nr:translational GTPase TypA [Alphaproteobacteria bacterium]